MSAADIRDRLTAQLADIRAAIATLTAMEQDTLDRLHEVQ